MEPRLGTQTINSQNSLTSTGFTNPLNLLKTTKTKKLPNNFQINTANINSANSSISQSPQNFISNSKQNDINPMMNPSAYSAVNTNSTNFMTNLNNSVNNNSFPQNSTGNMSSNSFSPNFKTSNINQILKQQPQMMQQSAMSQQLMQQSNMSQIMQQQIAQQQMIRQQLAQKQMMLNQQLSMLNNTQNQVNSNSYLTEDNDNIMVLFKIRGEGQNSNLVNVQINSNDSVSLLIEKYRNKTGDFEQKKRFIFNAKELKKNQTCIEAGLFNDSIVQVINIKDVNGAI